MIISKLFKALTWAFSKRKPVLLTGAPGIGKTDIIMAAAKAAGMNIIVSYPVTSDPTDFKGFPYPDASGKFANFLPYGDLLALTQCTEPTIFFLDDLGQAPLSVQAACMHLILGRHINGHKVPDCITFAAATNRKGDRAAVTGFIEPLKSRFASIIPLEVDHKDWINWALTNNMPFELIAYVNFQPSIFDDAQPSNDIENTVRPRTLASVGNAINDNLPDDLQYDWIAGAAGTDFAVKFCAFLKMYKQLPDLNAIILDPLNANVPDQVDLRYAIITGLSKKMNDVNIEPIVEYLNRMPAELGTAAIQLAIKRDKDLAKTRGFVNWCQKNGEILF
jgi:hypothetical protein